MMFYVFNTESAAVAAEATIVTNVRQWVAANVPNALSGDGERLRGRNASTGEFVEVYTDRWAIAIKTAAGKWVFAKPTQDKTDPIPVDVFTAGVAASEADYNAAWFPAPVMQ